MLLALASYSLAKWKIFNLTTSWMNEQRSKITCCLKRSALEAFLAKIRSPETRRSRRWTANVSSQWKIKNYNVKPPEVKHKIQKRVPKPQGISNIIVAPKEKLDTKQGCQVMLCLKDANNCILTILATWMHLIYLK